jgi:predicted nucleic acid-binding protein
VFTPSTELLLADTSALVRLLRQGAEDLDWDQSIAHGLVGICPITELELLVSARGMTERMKIRESLERSYPSVVMPDRVYERAAEVQELLTQKGKHRGPGAIDLLVAATAELTGRTLLHYDRDFETVAGATGQAAQWLAPPGSIA